MKEIDILKRANELHDKLVDYRHDFHMHPEVGFNEFTDIHRHPKRYLPRDRTFLSNEAVRHLQKELLCAIAVGNHAAEEIS